MSFVRREPIYLLPSPQRYSCDGGTMSTVPVKPQVAAHVLRCVHCGKVQETADRMFRCTQCSELLEVVYPEWASAPPGLALRLKEIWRERRGSSLPENASGVWRFRALLPQADRHNIV